MSDSIYIYAETAFHHEGDYDYMIRLIDGAKNAGVNGIKFQVIIDLNYLTSTKHTAYETLLKYTFSKEQWGDILNYANTVGLDVVFMPLDIASFDLLNEIDIIPEFIEIHPVCFYDQAIIAQIKKTNIPVIVGVGGRDEKEIKGITNNLREQLSVLMVGFQSFPSKLEDVKIKKIAALKLEYPQLTIGYADHSSYEDDFAEISNDYALLLGARIFEKHLTLNEGVKRVDFDSAIGVDRLKKVVSRLHYLFNHIVNVSIEQLNTLDEPELIYRNRQKVFVAKSNLKAGDVISADDLVMKMINKDQGIVDINQLIGKQLLENVEIDDIITKQQLK